MAALSLAALSAHLLLLAQPGVAAGYSFSVGGRTAADVQPHDPSRAAAGTASAPASASAAAASPSASASVSGAASALQQKTSSSHAAASTAASAAASAAASTAKAASSANTPAEPRLMRKEAAVLQQQQQQKHRQLDEPAGYYNRGHDCPGSQMTSGRFQPLFLKNAAVSDCAAQCSEFEGCVGFTFNQHQSACYFKATTCWNTTNNGWTFYQKETCDYSQKACEAAIENSDKYTRAANFVVNTEGYTGCLTRTIGANKNVVFYGQLNGRDIRIREELTQPISDVFARVEGYGCSSDGTLIQASSSTKETPQSKSSGGESLLEQDSDWEPLLVLEDELERVAQLSEETLMAEAAAQGLPWPPQRAAPRSTVPATIELGGDPSILLQETDEAEDEEDRRQVAKSGSTTAA